MPARTSGPVAAPARMTAMARVTGTTAALGALPAAMLAEMADLCVACPRTEACVRWMTTCSPGPAIPDADLCPNHATFAALSARPPTR